MKLTERQEKMVAAFFRQVGGQVDGLPPQERAQTLSSVKANLQQELRRFGEARPSDDDLAQVLNRCYPERGDVVNSKDDAESGDDVTLELERPEMPPREPAKPKDQPTVVEDPPTGLASPNRKWLGVCESLSERLGVDVLVLRSAFLVAGLALAPIALLVYAALYFERYLFGPDKGAPEIEWSKVWNLLAGVILGAIVMYAATRALFWGAEEIFTRAMGKPMRLDEWGWLVPRQRAYLTYTLVFAAPFALLGGLPLSSGWGYTLKRIAQVVLAVYGVTLSIGIASAIVGIILQVVDELALL